MTVVLAVYKVRQRTFAAVRDGLTAQIAREPILVVRRRPPEPPCGFSEAQAFDCDKC